DDPPERAAPTRVGLPHLPTATGREIDDADRPGWSGAPRRERQGGLPRRDADERELRAVGGPHGFAVVVDACVEKLERLRGHVIHADKAVVSAATHKRELRAVGCPGEFPDLLPIVFLVARHRAALVLGAGRDPDVAHALRVEDPGERSTRRRSHELVGKRRGERLLDRERALLGAGGAGREYEG